MNQIMLVGVVSLLPLTALITVLQKQPFYAVISRGTLGAVAALMFAVLGAPDVALTEALMGTLLTILLYLIAVRSSMMVKVGWSEGAEADASRTASTCAVMFDPVRRCCRKHFLEPEFIRFDDPTVMHEALRQGKLDAVFRLEGITRYGKEPEVTTGEATKLLIAPHARSLFQLFGESIKKEEIRVRIMGEEEKSENQ